MMPELGNFMFSIIIQKPLITFYAVHNR